MADPPKIVIPQIQLQPPPTVAASSLAAAPPPQTFLAKMKERTTTVGPDSKPAPPIIRIRGNRGVKTVAAFAIPLEDSADGRIKKTPGLPMPPGSRVLGISFDSQTEGSLKDHYAGTDVLQKNPIEVLHIAREMGWDPGRPKTALDVEDAFKEMLRDMAAKRSEWNVGMLVIDRCDLYTEDLLKGVCYGLAGMPVTGKLERDQWTPRSMKIGEMLALLPQAVLDGGCVVVTGSNEVNEGQVKLTNINGKWTQAPVQSKWASRIAHAMSVEIDVERAQVQGRDETIRHALVTESRRREQFPLGARIILDGRHIGAFLDPSSRFETVQEVLKLGSGPE